MTCRDVRRHLEAYVDDELAGADRLAVYGHLEACQSCSAELEALRDIGSALRVGAAGPHEFEPTLAGLASSVTSRIGAEQSQSWPAVWSRVFEDWHWVTVGLGAVAGALVSLVVAFSMLATSINQLAQMSARAGTLYIIALPQGGRGEPVLMEFEESLGSARTDARLAMPASLGWQAERALVSALDEKLVRSGSPASLRGLPRSDRDEILALLAEIAEFRLVDPPSRPSALTNVSGMHLRIDTSVTASGL